MLVHSARQFGSVVLVTICLWVRMVLISNASYHEQCPRSTFQNVKTDPAQLVCCDTYDQSDGQVLEIRNECTNVRVIDLGQEADLRRAHRILLGEEQLQVEYTTWMDHTKKNHMVSHS